MKGEALARRASPSGSREETDMQALVLREDVGAVATLTLNRPDKLNALSLELFGDLERHVAEIGADDSVQVVVVRGAGRCFSAGHDLGGIAEGEPHQRPNYQAHVVEALATLPQPVIAGVHGHCYTGALELALAADLIVAAASARFADTHARFALVPVWGMSQRLPRRVGTYKAREMMFTCRTYSGEEAAAMGLANLCVPDDGFDQALDDLSSTIVAQSSHSHRANKCLLLDTDGLSLAAGLAHEIYSSAGRGADMQARIAAFRDRK
jgi:enoyl-CoA hydratase/carnithine racemase